MPVRRKRMHENEMTVRDRYLEQMVESASPEGLLVLLVDGAVNFIRRAEISLEREKFDEAHNSFVKAQNIYLELTITLDLDAGEFAENLGNIYQFLYNLLIEANLDKDLEKTRLALKLAEQVRDLWKETVETAKGDGPDAAGTKAKLLSQGLSDEAVPKTGVYAPTGDAKIAEEKLQAEDLPSRLNITG